MKMNVRVHNLTVWMIYIVMICASSMGWALSASYVPFPMSDFERQSADKLRDFLSSHVVALDREMVTFHYQDPGSSDDASPANFDQIARQSADWGKGFFGLDLVTSDLVGPGHYVAIDPFASRSYGGTIDPQLFVVMVKKGTKILDVRQSMKNMATVFSDVDSALHCSERGGPGDIPRGLELSSIEDLAQWFEVFRNSGNESCRKILIRAVAELDVEAVIYSFAATNELADCRHNRTEALSIISPAAIDAKTLAFFSNKKAIDPSGIGGYVNALYKEGSEDLNLLNSLTEGMEGPPATLAPMTSAVADYEKWKAKYVLKCGAKWTAESEERPLDSLGYVILDKDIARLKFKLRRAYAAKVGGQSPSYFDTSLLRGYQQLVYEASGMAPDLSRFGSWIDAVKKVAHNEDQTPNYYNELGQILGDSLQKAGNISSLDGDSEVRVSKALLSYKERPDLMFTEYGSLGLGPKVTLLIFSRAMDYLNAIPLVTGPLPLIGGQDYRAYMAKNKATYMAFLSTCLLQYSDPNVSLEQINAGLCGLINIEGSP